MSQVAIADIGSNSARLVVMRRFGGAMVVPVSESKLPLGLQRQLNDEGELPPASIDAVVAAVADFSAVAAASGASRLVAVATSAVRNSKNVAEVLERVKRETGVDLRVLSGEEEGRFSYMGAVMSLPVENGVLVDIGGGSMELVRFEARAPVSVHTLPLGALLLSKQLAGNDPPTSEAQDALAAHVKSVLDQPETSLPLAPGEALIATGGTARNLAKIARRNNGLTFGRLHGHVITLSDLSNSIKQLTSVNERRRGRIPGLNPDRAGSIVAGAIALHETAARFGVESITVTGTGLREGLALEAFAERLYSTRGMERQTVRDMARRFASWDPGRASRRADIADSLCATLSESLEPEFRDAVVLAAELIDAGTAVDFYSRYESAAWLIEHSTAGALTHRQVALISATCLAADGERVSLPHYTGILAKSDRQMIARAGAVLSLADEAEMRVRPNKESSFAARLDIAKRKRLLVSWHGSAAWRYEPVAKQFKSAFGFELLVC